MTTDAWQQTRGAVTALWRRVRPEQADAVSGELTALRTMVTGEDGERAAAALTELWQLRLHELLLADSRHTEELTQELHELTEALRAAAPAAPRVGSVRMEARATGHGRVYQSGGDMHVNQEG
ncbi:hypothetical protein [Streptomyces longispororuber]|uniref:hypothetical protein n=1 Tax=Streptomyces longispororuber TaxID=68230 RepID=UPI002108B55F|nr:hypothetical protein [Streptomyces longispororuber]MCQ4208749.1 hypothetical protein [Streptomyces longispororuber]